MAIMGQREVEERKAEIVTVVTHPHDSKQILTTYFAMNILLQFF